MAGSISDFLASLSKTGVSKTSHFDVLLTAADQDMGRVLAFRCEAAEIPGRQLATIDNKIYGPVYKTPIQSVYAEMTMRFIETARLDIRVFFENWMNSIWDSDKNRLRYPDSWTREIQVIQYDMIANSPKSSNLNKVLTCRLIDAFPININQMPTDWSDDGFHRINVTFAYRKYSLIHHSGLTEDETITSDTNRQSSHDEIE